MERKEFRKLGVKLIFLAGILIYSLITSLESADPLDNWHWRNPLPQDKSLSGIAYGKSIFVAVGDSAILQFDTLPDKSQNTLSVDGTITNKITICLTKTGL